MSDDSGLTFLTSEDIDEASKRDTIVTLELESPEPGVLGKTLLAIENMLSAAGVRGTIRAKGYERTFYGWDEEQ